MQTVWKTSIGAWLLASFLAGLILGGGMARGGVLADAVPIYLNTFDQQADVNFDNWPDRWERSSGEFYHHYTDVAIVDHPDTDDGRCLQFDLKGGGIQVSTPPIRVLPKFSYWLQFRVKSEGLVHTQLTVKVDLMDRHGKVLQQVEGTRLRDVPEWTNIVNFPRIHAQHSDIDRAIIRFDLPRQGRGDLAGKLWIDQIELVRLPSMTVTTGRECNVYDDFSQIKVKCTLSGIRDRNPEIRFQLLDATSRVIPGKTEDRLIDGKLIVEDTRWASDIVGGIGNRPDGYEGSTVWEPDIEDFGFYKVRVKMLSQDRRSSENDSPYPQELDDQEITLVVLPELPPAVRGEFGWTLPQADHPLPFELLEELMPRVGIHWIKLPVWFPANDPARGEALVKFAERVSGSGIEVVGIVDEPLLNAGDPPVRNLQPNVASFLQADPSIWQPMYDHVMTRLSLRLRYWQLGGDADTGFYSYQNLAGRIEGIRKNLFRFGQDVKLGLGWRWPVGRDKESWIAPDEKPSWEFEQFTSRSPLLADEINESLATMPQNGTLRWSQVDSRIQSPPIPEELVGRIGGAQLRHDYRIREFIRQMIAAKVNGADGIFISDPFTGPDGVMNTDGTPGELLLPWRTTSILLGGKTYLGSLQMPSGCTNHVFIGNDDRVVMVAWSDQEVTERLYLGEGIKQVDVWGKQSDLVRHDHEVELRIGRKPTFFVNLHPQITRFRMALEFSKTQVPSVFSIEHENSLKGKNFFRQGIEATATIHVPPLVGEESRFGSRGNEHWDISPRQLEMTMSAGESFEAPFRFLLKDAAYAVQPIRIDFHIEADQEYRFSVWRDIRVGTGEVEIALTSRLDDAGNLIVEQRMMNYDTTPANFKCMLYAPPRRRKRTHVVMLDSQGSTKIYQYPDGEALVGKVLTLKAEEIHGQRVLIYRFVAQRGGE